MSASELKFICEDCRLQYPDRQLLRTHKQKFCKGSKVQRRQNDILLDEHDYDTLDDYVPSNRFQQVSRARQSEHSNTHYGRQSTNTRKHRHTMNDDPKERITKLREKREGLANEMLQIQNVMENRKTEIKNNSAIVNELSDMRRAYLRVGGHDPVTMSRLTELEVRAIELRNARHRQQRASVDERERDIRRFVDDVDVLNGGEMALRTHRRDVETIRRDHKVDLLLTEMRVELNHLTRSRTRAHSAHSLDMSHRPKSSTFDELPLLFQRPSELIEEIQSTKLYDPSEGFACFFDYVTSTPACHMTVRLVTALFNSSESFRDPTVMRKVKPSETSVIYDIGRANTMVLGYHLSMKHIPNSRTMSMIIELQLAEPGKSLISKAWCKIPLFDNKSSLISGNWRLKLRKLPLVPGMTLQQLNVLEQFNEMELFYRIVNSDSIISAAGISLVTNDLRHYHYLTQKILPDILDVPPPPSVTPPLLNSDTLVRQPHINPYTKILKIIDVRAGGNGKAKVKITIYHRSTGEIAKYPGGPVTCDSAIVRSSFAWNRHIFGKQVAVFRSFALTSDLVAVLRFYLIGSKSDEEALTIETSEGHLHSKNLVAWGALPLTKGGDLLNSGLQRVQLFHPPVPTISSLPFRKAHLFEKYRKYQPVTSEPSSGDVFTGNSRVKLRIFENSETDNNDLSSSDTESDDCNGDETENILPTHCWLLYERSIAPVEPFLDTDGFDLYIDGCRYLPVACTITRVTCILLDRNFSPLESESGTSINLNSPVNCPTYGERVEFRGHALPSTATLLFKIYTMDRNSHLVVVGYSTLNAFTESGTFNQPAVDTKGIQISLNDGGHQLRVYSLPPGGADAFCEASLRHAANRIVPCASLLVRLRKASRAPGGETLESRDIPRSDWLSLGLWEPMPNYADRVYYSITCRPTKGETRIFNAFESEKYKNTIISVKAMLKRLIPLQEYRALNSDKKMQAFVRNQLTKLMDLPAISLDLNFVVPYSPKCGIKFSVDCAINLPWQNFSFVTTCLSPPGAFYKGFPYTTYDKLTYTHQVDLNSTSSNPTWFDGYKSFPNRNSFNYLVMVCHLHELSVRQDNNGITYKLVRQVFTSGYLGSSQLQLPLYEGPPSPRILQQMETSNCLECLDANHRLGNLTHMKRASIVVRICDSRRDDEIEHFTLCDKPQVSPDLEYLPENTQDNDYKWLPGDSTTGRTQAELVPEQLNPSSFVDNLGDRVKKLVHQAHGNELNVS